MKFESVADVLEHYGVEVDSKLGNSKNYLVRCPFHQDSKPSCSVHKINGLFLCFSCGASGSIIKLISHLAGCDWSTAKKLWEDDESVLKLETKKVKDIDIEIGFLDIIKLMNNLIFQTEIKPELANLEINNYITEDNHKRRLFFKMEEKLFQDWLYFGIVDDPYTYLLNIMPEELKTELRNAFKLLNGENICLKSTTEAGKLKL